MYVYQSGWVIRAKGILVAVWCIGFEGGNYEEKALVNAVVQITLEYEIIFPAWYIGTRHRI